MPRTIVLKNKKGEVVGKLNAPDDATPEQIKAAMSRLAETIKKREAANGVDHSAAPASAPAEPSGDDLIKCAACDRDKPPIRRRDLDQHVAKHRRELEQLEQTARLEE